MVHLPEEVVEAIMNKLTTNRDRNSVSLVNKLWYAADRNSRRIVYVSNCYAVSHATVIDRFPNLRSLTLKDKPGICNPRLLGNDLVDSVDKWIEVLTRNCPLLEKLRLKRVSVSDQSLNMISICFRNFRSLILSSCSGFTIAGLSAIASNCLHLEQLEVERCDITDNTGRFLSCFRKTSSSLISLNISCIKGEINPTDLEQLVARSPNITTLSLNKSVSVNTIRRILTKSPQIVHLGVGSTLGNLEILSFLELSLSLHQCESIESLAFFYRIPKMLIHSFDPICRNLVYVNARFASVVTSSDLVGFISKCPKLRRLCVRSCIGDDGLKIVSNSCKNLEDVKVFNGTQGVKVTEVGLTALSTGCQKLKSLTYFCSQMTNLALTNFSKNCPNITCFKLIISGPKQRDHLTREPLDHGFRDIVESCKNLNKLTVSGLLTNDVFLYIGMYAERLEVLSVTNVGDDDKSLNYVFNGCKNLRKVEINKRDFGDVAILANIYEF